MFINVRVLKNLMKAAYKAAGLILGRCESTIKEGELAYIIAGLGFQIVIEETSMTKEIKGLMMSIAGIIPEEERVYKLREDMDTEEIEDKDKGKYGIGTISIMKFNEMCRGSNLIIEEAGRQRRIVLSTEGNRSVAKTVLEIMIALVNNAKEKNDRIGPVRDENKLLWYDQDCRVLIYTMSDENIENTLVKDVIKYIESEVNIEYGEYE